MIPVLLPGRRFENCSICEVCRRLLEVGWRQTSPDSALGLSLDGPEAHLTEQQVRDLVEAGLQAESQVPIASGARPDLERQLLVHDELGRIDVDLLDAEAAISRGDWSAGLQAIRMIGGRAVITRRVLEGMLGAPAASLPPLVRAAQAVNRVISDQEVNTLPPDELRLRIRAMLAALDAELHSFLEPSGPLDRTGDDAVDDVSGAGRP
jgi:hypothetical protein